MLNSTEHEISAILINKDFSCFKPLVVVFILLINIKMPTIIGILTIQEQIKFHAHAVKLSMKGKKVYPPGMHAIVFISIWL